MPPSADARSVLAQLSDERLRRVVADLIADTALMPAKTADEVLARITS